MTKTQSRKSFPALHPVPGAEFRQADSALLRRLNSAYEHPLYHLCQPLGLHDVEDFYIDAFRLPAIQESLSHIFDSAHRAERNRLELSSPLCDVRELDKKGIAVAESALQLSHSPHKQWHLLAARPIGKGDLIGHYAGEPTRYDDLDEADKQLVAPKCVRFVQHIIDSYPHPAGFGAKTRDKLCARLKDALTDWSPYSFLISLPRPGSNSISITIDAMKAGNLTRFMSHCATPNLERVFVRDCRNGTYFIRILFFAKSDIAPGEELTFHYGMDESLMGAYHDTMTAMHQRILDELAIIGLMLSPGHPGTLQG